MKRELDWQPIEQAPNKQDVLIWDKYGDWHPGYVVQRTDCYEVYNADASVLLGATHYAIVIGP